MDNEITNNVPNVPDWSTLAILAGMVFNPNTPIDAQELFSGRRPQIRRVIDVVLQKGQHAVIFGERGVGKTSLSNVLGSFVPNQSHNLLSIRVNGDRADTFQSIWEKVFEEINLIQSAQTVGFSQQTKQTSISGLSLFGEGVINPDTVRRALVTLGRDVTPIVVIDEFDRLPDDVRRLFADLIKNLSDHSVNATVILIGVGDSVDHLIQEHQSVSRSLVQVPMPRMNPDEIKNIIVNGLAKLGMTIEVKALTDIVNLAQGLPHYAHLIGLHASRNALDNHSLTVGDGNFNSAIQKALEDAQQSIRTQYHDAIRSAHADNLFSEVLLACALSPVDEVGTFAAQDIRGALKEITGKDYAIPSFARHLSDFCEIKRCKILTRIGDKRKYRYKFTDPLMQPYVIMQGVNNNMIPIKNITGA
jgi:Cdc6-like AAA superfamily ATPase